eukprot:1127988-Pelagomonas_calceolata.AAC.1
MHTQKRWKNGIKSRGIGGIDTRNVFGHNFIQLTRVWKMEWLEMRGSRLCVVAANRNCKVSPR